MAIASTIEKILSEFTFAYRGIIQKQLGLEFTNPEDLTHFIYNFYYCNGSLKKANLNYYLLGTTANHFLCKLRKANKSTGYYIPGWLVLSKLNGCYIVSKNGIKLFVNPTRHFKRNDLSAKIGDTVAIKFPNERIFSSRGYYVAISNEGMPSNNQQIVRLYLHLKPFHAVYMLSVFTRQFSRVSRIPFIYKTLLDPQDYKRRDSAVMYFNKNDFFCVMSFTKKFRAIQPSLFLRGTPLFTKRLSEGISVAEEPLKKKGTESFGQHRCRIVSEGIFKAYRNNIFNKHEILNLIIGNLSKWKVNIKYPFLNERSVDIYNLKRE
jgi:hypothetical protein